MKTTYYYAAWSDGGSDCHEGCDHKHRTVASAVACMKKAGAYVVAVELRKRKTANGYVAVGEPRLRELNEDEAVQFEQATHGIPPQRYIDKVLYRNSFAPVLPK